MDITLQEERLVSFLPLSHVAANITDILVMLTCVGTVFFADRNALKGTLTQSLREAQPTIFLGVPRVWEKIYEKMVEVGRQNKGLKQQIGGLVICKISGDNTGVAKRVSPGLEKFDSILSYQFYLTLPATLSQPGVLS